MTDSGDLTVGGTTTVGAAGFDVTLDQAGNNFTGAVGVTGANVALVDASGIDLGASTVSGNLSVSASGAITDSGNLAVTGTTTLAAGSANNITLNSAGNNFTGAVTITSANDATLVDTGAIELGTSTVSGTLAVSSVGDNTDSGALTETGTTT